MARQCVAVAARAGAGTARGRAVHPDLARMSRGELIDECMILRGKCADKNATIKDMRGQVKSAEARAAAAVSERNKLAKRCATLEKKVDDQKKAIRNANDMNARLVDENKSMIAGFEKAAGDVAAMKRAVAHHRAKSIGVKPNTKGKKASGRRKKAAQGGAAGGGARRRPARRRRRAGGGGGANSIPGKADETYEIDMTNCLDCGEKLSKVVGEYKRRTVEAEEMRRKIIDYLLKRRWCRRCNKVCTPPAPNTVRGSPLSLKMHMLAACLRILGMSLEKIHYVMAFLLGMAHISSRSTVLKMIRRLARALGPSYHQLRGDLLKELNIHGDETGWRVDGQNQWLWAFIGRWSAYFVIDPSRGAAVPMRVLDGYGGNVTSDSWPAWNHVGGTHQKCHVHYIRWIDERLEYDMHGKEFRLFARTLKKILYDSQDAAGRRMSKKAMDECIRRLDARIDRLIGKSYSDERCLQMVKRLKREKDMLFTFILTGTDPDNNPAERPLRVPVSVRKMIGGNRTEEGAGDYAVLLSVDTSSKMRGSNLYDFCMEQLGNVGKTTVKRIK